MLKSIEILTGYNKDGNKENIPSIKFERGFVYTIVGNTGSGKTQFIEDIESLNNGEGVTKRKILIDGKIPDESLLLSYRSRFIAHLSQNMNFIIDMSVIDFFTLRERLRLNVNCNNQVKKIISTANNLAGEVIQPNQLLTKLSGGQSRALMIADVALNKDAPIVLIDEVENAGIDKMEALSLLVSHDKIVIVVTHDPLIELYGKWRILFENGGIKQVITRTKEEEELLSILNESHSKIEKIRHMIRTGRTLEGVAI